MLGISKSTWIVIALAIRSLALVFGANFLLVGICGFISGCVTNYDTMTFFGHNSKAMLFGIFQVSVLHNAIHLLLGVAGLLCFGRAVAASRFLLVGGLIYLGLWIYGLAMLAVDGMSLLNFVPLNNADNWLHFGLGVGMTLMGLTTRPVARYATAALDSERTLDQERAAGTGAR